MAEKKRYFKNTSDLTMAVAVIAVVMMLIVPLPTVLLDVLMASNLLLALLILLIVMYTPRAIDFSFFPTMLLISTVYGLALNVSSTRLILTQGARFNGQLITAFGSFVVGSGGTEGLVVGLVIFIVLIAVQAFVITKGATRIAEVAARFTLDAMPMKQAAVESEYNQGAITEDEARQKKLEIQREAGFYGSMDGATKFVSGNVKVGIFITVINLVAGVIFGMVLRSEPFNQAIQTYAKFTIGDGLLSQIPSLFISVATGLIVTRSASDGKSSMGQEAQRQFSQNAWIFYVAGVTMALIGFLPGFPWYVLIPLGAALFYIGRRLQIKQAVAFETKLEKEKEKQQTQGGSSADISPIVPLDPLSLELGFALIPLVDKEKGAELLERITRIRRESALDMGLVVPRIRIIDNMRLDPNEYCFKIKGVEVGSSHIRMGWYMCMNTGSVSEEIHGEATTDPAFGLPAVWIPEEQREQAERSGYAVVDAPTIIATHLTELIKSHAAEILGRQEIQAIVDALKKEYPAVVEEVTKLFNMGEIQKVMQGLLKEQVSVRNMVAIFETMADFGPITKKPDVLVEKVRQALGRQICLQYADENRNLRVFTVAPDFLQKLVASRVDTVNGPIAALDPVDQRDWISAVSTSIASSQKTGNIPVILCPEEARILVKASTEREIPNLVVLSVPEIVNDIKLENLGEIRVGA
ncbi:MAG: flagellar biosynthesis protein FlhA [Treponema lecithinolyticum]|uniref:flagellar biosynthesis protein FlhA n=1 Tax=Treponema lecithinolyticum TaxID=53418 RepID=UPI0036149997